MDLLGAAQTVDLLGFAWFCTKSYGKVLVRSAGVATGQTHQCASKFDMGLYRAWVTACPQKTCSTHLGLGFFSLGVLRVATLHFHFFPDKDKPWTMHARAHKTSPSMKLHRQQSKKNQTMFRPGHMGLFLARRTSFVTCTRNSHQGWIQMAASIIGLLQIKSPKKPIKMSLASCEESTDEHRGK